MTVWRVGANLAVVEHQEGQLGDLLLGPAQHAGDLAQEVVAGGLVKPLGDAALGHGHAGGRAGAGGLQKQGRAVGGVAQVGLVETDRIGPFLGKMDHVEPFVGRACAAGILLLGQEPVGADRHGSIGLNVVFGSLQERMGLGGVGEDQLAVAVVVLALKLGDRFVSRQADVAEPRAPAVEDPDDRHLAEMVAGPAPA